MDRFRAAVFRLTTSQLQPHNTDNVTARPEPIIRGTRTPVLESSAPKRLPTIVDVAELAGVSVSTVSRVLNEKSDVSAKTRARITQAIAELNFAPRATAQRLVGGRSHTVSMMFPSSYGRWANYDLDFLLGAADATVGKNYFFHLAPDVATHSDFQNLYMSGLAEGAILMQITENDWRVEFATQLQLPCVLIGRTGFAHNISWVDFDFDGAVGAMIDHLVQTGHRRIGFIGRPRESLSAGLGSSLRLQRGYDQAVLRHGLEPCAVPTDLDPIAAGQSALHILDNFEGVSAIVTTSGRAAGGVMKALHERGISVPHDINVMSIATAQLADMTTPSLSGVDFPSAQLGFHAANVLVRQLDDRAVGQTQRTEQILLPAQLTLRGTTSPVKTR